MKKYFRILIAKAFLLISFSSVYSGAKSIDSMNLDEINPVFQNLIERKEFEEAERFANDVFEYWSKQKPNSFLFEGSALLQLALTVSSEFYYSTFMEKMLSEEASIKDMFEGSRHSQLLNSIFVKNDYFNQDMFFKRIPISTTCTYLSICDCIVQRIYVDPEILKIYEIEVDEFRQILETQIHDLLRSNEYVFKILHAIALYLKESPYFRIHILMHGNMGRVGVLFNGIQKIQILLNPIDKKGVFGETLIHELTHQLMDVIYQNSCNPYRKNDHIREKCFKESTRILEEKMGIIRDMNYSLTYVVKTILKTVRTQYFASEFDKEYIVRFPQTIVSGQYDDFEVRDIINPLKEFWDSYVGPDIDEYIDQRSYLEYFVSDSKPERYLPISSDDEFKRDLNKVKNTPYIPMSGARDSREKWANRGDLGKAYALDKIFIQKAPRIVCDLISDDWHGRGDFDKALEVDKVIMGRFPERADQIVKRWRIRGIALD